MGACRHGIRQAFWLLAAFGLLFMIGCGSTKITAKAAGEKIFQAESAVSDARDGNASVNAKQELGVAEEKLATAKVAFGREDYTGAANLAELAVVDAQYAGERATTQKNLNLLDAMKKENDVLRKEIQEMAK